MRFPRGLRGPIAFALMMAGASAAGAQTPAPADPAAPPVDLSQLSLEELVDLKIDSVYGASRFHQKVTEAPSSVTIVTAEEIERYGHRTLADILRSVRGFYVTYDRNYSYLGVRGFSRPGDYNSRVLLLVDGHRLNDPIFDHALLGTEFPMDVDLIERVEIIRGPSSSLYGTSAFFGVVNVITKPAEHVKGVNATGTLASLDTRHARVTYGQSFANGVALLLSGSAYGSDGQRRLFFAEFDHPSTNRGVAEGADGDRFDQMFGKMTKGRFVVQGLYGTRDKVIPTASFGTVFNDPRTRTIERRGYLDVQFDQPLESGWQLGSRVHYDRYSYDGDYVFEYPADAGPMYVVNRDAARGDWWGAEAKLSGRVARRHNVTGGIEYRDKFRQNQLNYDEEPFVAYLDDRRSSWNWALFVQDEISLHSRLLLNVGFRHDQYDSFGGTTNPRVGLIFLPAERTSLKLLYGSAFRAPNAYELFWRQSGVTKANPTLEPETNRTLEAVAERYLTPKLRVGATGFYYRLKDLITQETDPADELLVYTNIEASRARGIELETEARLSERLRGRASYTFQDSHRVGADTPLTNSPKHLVQLNLTSPVLRRAAQAGFELQYLSARRTLSGREVGSVVVPNFTFTTRKLPKNLVLSASVYNLFDRQYGDPGSEEHRQDAIVQNGRSVRVKLSYRFASFD